VLSATVRDQAIGEAEVLLQKNGQQSGHGFSDRDGNVSGNFPLSADDPATTLIIRKAGYSTLVAKCPCNKLSYAMSPVMQQLDGLRIVLNWAASPLDLDAHLVYPGQHVYWYAPNGASSELDVDQRLGFGPETITIQSHHLGQRYIYAVHDYSDKAVSSSNSLELGRPQERVYVGQTLVRSYTTDPSKKGNLWSVFAITENGELEDLDQYSDVEAPEAVGSALAEEFSSPVHAVVHRVSSDDRFKAGEFNRDGEVAYRHRDLDTAISLFKQAIELDPYYGQAYSNLGLSFEKAGDEAEAIWADRKAIALATDTGASGVRASSYFNIAHIYESKSEWTQALESYRRAEREKHNEVYVASMARIQQKLNCADQGGQAGGRLAPVVAAAALPLAPASRFTAVQNLYWAAIPGIENHGSPFDESFEVGGRCRPVRDAALRHHAVRLRRQPRRFRKGGRSSVPGQGQGPQGRRQAQVARPQALAPPSFPRAQEVSSRSRGKIQSRGGGGPAAPRSICGSRRPLARLSKP
jgi:tetratricopeptide (TPR) repeat protein